MARSRADQEATRENGVDTKPAASIEAAPNRRRRDGSFARFSTAIRYLESRVNLERSRMPRAVADAMKLDRMHALLDRMGNPHRSLRCVHVAGSKGKGSVCEMVASCLDGCGYGVGLYTSPHVADIRERIRVAGRLISEAAMTRSISRVRDAAVMIAEEHGEPTYFEVLTAAALHHFAEQAVDIAVLEVGLGGRLDATNVVKPDVVGLTEIHLEHCEILGDTLEKIAAEKAGIMKPGVPALSVPQPGGVIEVFEAKAAEVGCELALLGREIDYSVRFESAHRMKPHARVCVSTPRSRFEHLPSPLTGEHQAPNCGLALAIMDRLREQGLGCDERSVATGLARTPAGGRMELVWERPRVMIDGAHTPESLGSLIRALSVTQTFDSLVMVFGCSADKDIDGMLREIGRGADKAIFTRAAGSARGVEPRELTARFGEITGKMSQTEPDPRAAINAAARAVGPGDLIVVTGSFHVAGEAKALFDAKRSGTLPASHGAGS